MVDLRLVQVGHGNGNHWWKVNYSGCSSCESFLRLICSILLTYINNRSIALVGAPLIRTYCVKMDVKLLIATYPHCHISSPS